MFLKNEMMCIFALVKAFWWDDNDTRFGLDQHAEHYKMYCKCLPSNP